MCKCKTTKCNSLEHAAMLTLFNKFYTLSHSRQTEYLMQECIVLCDVNHRVVAENISRRHCTFKYYIKSTAVKLHVCLTTLCNIFAITPRHVQMIQNKMKQTDVCTNDMRGKHMNRPHAIPNDIKNLIREHINSLPAQENHYSRHKNGNIKFLSADLNIQKLYVIYSKISKAKGYTTPL